MPSSITQQIKGFNLLIWELDAYYIITKKRQILKLIPSPLVCIYDLPCVSTYIPCVYKYKVHDPPHPTTRKLNSKCYCFYYLSSQLCGFRERGSRLEVIHCTLTTAKQSMRNRKIYLSSRSSTWAPPGHFH